MTVAVPTAWRTRVTPDQREAILLQHQLIATAIGRRDADAAAAAMGDHFDASIGSAFAR